MGSLVVRSTCTPCRTVHRDGRSCRLYSLEVVFSCYFENRGAEAVRESKERRNERPWLKGYPGRTIMVPAWHLSWGNQHLNAIIVVD